MSNFLVVEVADLKCAFAVSDVIETMRPLPVEPISDAPPYVLGLSIIRGTAVPVVDLSRVLNIEAEEPKRFVTLRSEGRAIAAGVSNVVGLVELDDASIGSMPTLVGESDASSLAIRDSTLVRILNSARLIDEETWRQISQLTDAR